MEGRKPKTQIGQAISSSMAKISGRVLITAATASTLAVAVAIFYYIKRRSSRTTTKKRFYSVVEDQSSKISLDSHSISHNSLTALGLDQPVVILEQFFCIFIKFK